MMGQARCCSTGEGVGLGDASLVEGFGWVGRCSTGRGGELSTAVLVEVGLVGCPALQYGKQLF